MKVLPLNRIDAQSGNPWFARLTMVDRRERYQNFVQLHHLEPLEPVEPIRSPAVLIPWISSETRFSHIWFQSTLQGKAGWARTGAFLAIIRSYVEKSPVPCTCICLSNLFGQPKLNVNKPIEVVVGLVVCVAVIVVVGPIWRYGCCPGINILASLK